MEKSTARGVDTGVAMMNLMREEMTVDLKLCAIDGGELASSQVILPAEGHLARYVNEFDWDQFLPADQAPVPSAIH